MEGRKEISFGGGGPGRRLGTGEPCLERFHRQDLWTVS